MVVNVFLTVSVCQRRNIPTKKERAKVRFFEHICKLFRVFFIFLDFMRYFRVHRTLKHVLF